MRVCVFSQYLTETCLTNLLPKGTHNTSLSLCVADFSQTVADLNPNTSTQTYLHPLTTPDALPSCAQLSADGCVSSAVPASEF